MCPLTVPSHSLCMSGHHVALCLPIPTPASYHLIPQVGVIGLTTILLVWAAGFRAWGVWVSPSILANESLYYPLEVRRQPGRGEGG